MKRAAWIMSSAKLAAFPESAALIRNVNVPDVLGVPLKVLPDRVIPAGKLLPTCDHVSPQAVLQLPDSVVE